MRIEKKVIGKLEKCYALAPFFYKGKECFLAASEKEAECLGQRFIVSNMRGNGENVELRVISEKQPMREAELLDGTLEDAYLYETQSAEET